MKTRNGLRVLLILSVVAARSAACGAQGDAFEPLRKSPPAAGKTARPAEWAQKIDKPGLPNFHQVSTSLYRGAQPVAGGIEQLKTLGIRTVINLRAGTSDTDKLSGSSLKGERFPMRAWHGNDEDVVRFLKVVSNTNNLPAFVHCRRGSDRTGLMCAMYRIALCGWTREEAIREMTQGGFGFNPLWKNLVYYVEEADIGKLKRQAGMREE